MKTKRKKHILAAALVSALAATNAQAQTEQKYKMTTDIPADITTPDSVETRLGALNPSGTPSEKSHNLSKSSKIFLTEPRRSSHAPFLSNLCY